MSYTPPLNGGRINVTISGSTAGNNALVSTGTLALAGGNNITLSQATGAGGNTISISAFNQSNQAIGLTAVSNTTQGSTGTVDARSMSFAGAGIASVGITNSSVVVSVPAGGGAAGSNTLGISNLGNTLGNSGVISGSALQYVFAGGNNIVLSQSINASSATVTISASSQSNQTLSYAMTGNTTSNATAGTIDARSLTHQGLGALSVGVSTSAGGSSLIFSAPQTSSLSATGAVSISTNGTVISIGAPSQTNQTLNILASSQTVGQSSTSTYDARSLSIVGQGGISVGWSNSSLLMKDAPMTVNGTSNSVTISGGNNITVGNNASTITISAPNQSNQTIGLYALGNTTQNSSTTLDARTLSFNGLGAATLGYSNGSIQVSVPAPVTLASWEPWPIQNTATAALPALGANTNTSGSASFVPFTLAQNVAAGYLNMVQSLNLTTGGTSVFSQSGTLNYGLYTRGTGANSTTLSQITSGSYSYQMSYNNSTMTVSQVTASATNGLSYGSTTSAGLNLSSGYTGLKLVQLPIASTLTPGAYWLGLFDRASTAGFNSGIKYSYVGNAMSLTGLAPIGSFSTAYSTGTGIPSGQGGNWLLGGGVFTSVGQTNLPNTLALSAMTANISVIPYMKFVVS